jgi:hypothetical protein
MHISRPSPIASRVRSLAVATIASALVVLTGCQVAYFLNLEEDKEVKAEYNKIGSRAVAVLVWADQSTLDEDPRVRQRICKAVTYYLKKNLPGANLVLPEEVTKLQERQGNVWEDLSTKQLCDRLKCDLILRIDLLECTTRAGDARELRRGRVRATVNLYDSSPDAGREVVYQTEVLAKYPPESGRSVFDMDDADLLHETVEHFAELTARKFYDHKQSLRGPAEK